MRAVLPKMRTRRSGTILIVSSCGAFFGLPTAGTYVATKWALEGLCESLLHDVLPLGVKIKVLEPSGVDTPFLPRAASRSKDTGGISDYDDSYSSFQ